MSELKNWYDAIIAIFIPFPYNQVAKFKVCHQLVLSKDAQVLVIITGVYLEQEHIPVSFKIFLSGRNFNRPPFFKFFDLQKYPPFGIFDRDLYIGKQEFYLGGIKIILAMGDFNYF